MALWRGACECWGAHPRGQVWAPLFQEARLLEKTLAHPILIATTPSPLLVEHLLRGTVVPRKWERSMMPGQCVPSYTHACTPI